MRPIKVTTRQIVDRIMEHKVAKIEQLARHFDCSAWTLFNKLKEHEYYTSYNSRGQYITLEDTPTFDDMGIWKYKQAMFSKWRNVEETIHHIVDMSPAGLTPGEITKILRIRTHNQLVKCRRKGTLVSKRYGRNMVYYSTDEETRRNQTKKRESELGRLPRLMRSKPLSNKMIIDVLLAIIKHHEIKPENIVSIMTFQGKKISERGVQWVLEEYEIKKKNF